MILCVCLNPALDVTYAVDDLVHGASHRVQVVGERAGGKTLNVARVLTQLGEPVLVTGLAGGPTGELIRADLDAAGIGHDLTTLGGASRRTVAVIDRRDATVFNEPGPVVTDDEWAAFLTSYEEQLGTPHSPAPDRPAPDRPAPRRGGGFDVVVLSGSLPPGVPTDGYRHLVGAARSAGARVLLDATGPSVQAALAAGPDVLLPNRAELVELAGRALPTTPDVLAACRELVAAGAGTVLASLGTAGLLAVVPGGSWLVRTPYPLEGNPTGAGDALAAAVAAGLATGQDWPAVLRRAVAVAAASVTQPLAGATDVALAAEMMPTIRLEELPVTTAATA